MIETKPFSFTTVGAPGPSGAGVFKVCAYSTTLETPLPLTSPDGSSAL